MNPEDGIFKGYRNVAKTLSIPHGLFPIAEDTNISSSLNLRSSQR
jgi:hypothetical protein